MQIYAAATPDSVSVNSIVSPEVSPEVLPKNLSHSLSCFFDNPNILNVNMLTIACHIPSFFILAGIKIPRIQPITIPTISEIIGVLSTPDNVDAISPTALPTKAPKKSGKYYPILLYEVQINQLGYCISNLFLK